MRGTSQAPSARSKSKTSSKPRLRFGILAALMAVLALALPGSASALPLGETESFTGATEPHTVAAGPDGNVWFTDIGTSKIGRVTPGGTVTEYGGLTSVPFGIATGSDGKIWFTEHVAGKIGVIDPSNPEAGVTEYSTGLQEKPFPLFITAGPDGNLWFVDQGLALEGENKIGRITTSGTITEFSAGLNAGAVPCSIAPGNDGNVWFTDCGTTRAIGKITPSGEITEYALPETVAAPVSIAKGPDGNMWFVQNSSELKRVGKITPSGVVTMFTTPNGNFSSITAGPDGNLWVQDGTEANDKQEYTIKATSGLGGSYKLCPEVESKKECTSALAFSATSATIKTALGALAIIGGSTNVNVAGTGSTSPVKRSVTFTGKFARTEMPEITCDGSALTGTEPSCTMVTTSNGISNKLLRVTPTGATTQFQLKPALKVGANSDANHLVAGPDGNLWFTDTGLGKTLTKFGTECVEGCPTPNKRSLTLTKAPDPSTGAGIGTVTSKAKGINCASACTEAVGRFYKNTSVILTEKPYGETSLFKEWNNVGDPGGACDGSTLATCTVSMSEDQEIEAVFKGTSKAILSPTALTLSKGASEDNYGYGTVKATGLVCESECQETTVLYQGKVTSPKVIAPKTVELKALAAFGSKFTGWSGGGCSGTEPSCKVTMDEAKTVTAEFADLPDKVLTLEKAYAGGLGTVMSKQKGIKCANTCMQAVASMPEGAAIVLTAKPATTEPPTTFVEWEGGDCDESKSTTCTVTMDEAETLKAVFSGPVKAIVNPQKLTLNRTGSGYGTVKATGLTCEALCTSTSGLYYGPVTEPKVKAGAKVIVKAASAPGSKAVEWTGCESNPTPSECVVVMSEAKTVSAKFDELE